MYSRAGGSFPGEALDVTINGMHKSTNDLYKQFVHIEIDIITVALENGNEFRNEFDFDDVLVEGKGAQVVDRCIVGEDTYGAQ